MMRKIIFLFLSLLFFFPMVATAFTVSQPNNLDCDSLYLRKSFINRNSFSEEIWITIKVQIVSNNVIRNRNNFIRMNQAIATFSSVMEKNHWLVRAWSPRLQKSIVDGILTFNSDGSPKYINQLNGRARTVYYNHNMGLRGYFITVNQKIHRRLSNAGFIPCQETDDLNKQYWRNTPRSGNQY